MRAGIIGHGVVGQAQERMFAKAGYSCVIYDKKYAGAYPRARLEKCDFAVICTGTPNFADGRQDRDAVTLAYRQLPPGLPVMIRSTVRPGTTDWLIRSTPGPGPTVFVPEFLTERDGAGWPESTDVPWMILGGDKDSRDFFMPILLTAAGHGRIRTCTALQAELAKYTANLYWATRVTFVNEMARICKTFGADWEGVRRAWVEDARVGGAYTEMQGFPPGFGGACWPKDLSALIHASADRGYEPGFLRAVQKANERFRR